MPTTRMPRPTALLACAAALAGALLAGCGPGGNPAGTATTAQGNGAPDASTEAIVRCYRAHGDPGFPDPVYDPGDGRWHFAVSPGSAPLATRQACRRLFPAGAVSPPVPQAQFQRLVLLAGCLRRHGLPNWPDPDPDGGFGLPRSLLQKTPAYARAARACQRFMPSGGLNVYAAS